MSSNANEIKMMLKKYYYFTAIISSGSAGAEITGKMQAIKSALESLNAVDRSLIEMLYIQRQPAEDVARQLFVDRSTVFRRAKAIVNEMWYCFGEKFLQK